MLGAELRSSGLRACTMLWHAPQEMLRRKLTEGSLLRSKEGGTLADMKVRFHAAVHTAWPPAFGCAALR